MVVVVADSNASSSFAVFVLAVQSFLSLFATCFLAHSFFISNSLSL